MAILVILLRKIVGNWGDEFLRSLATQPYRAPSLRPYVIMDHKAGEGESSHDYCWLQDSRSDL